MHGLRSTRKYFVTSLAAITLILLTASTLAAQAPTVAVEKPAVESSAVPTDPTTPTATTKEETIKTESEPATPATAPPPPQVVACPPGTRRVRADVVAIPQPLMLNRLGATIPNGFVFALRSDTIKTGLGNIQLRPGKRPRPIVLRANVGDCLRISFQNGIPASNFGQQAATPQSPAIATTEVSLHIQGQEWAVGSA